MPPIRVYADTSVFGGVFDVEFESASRTFFDQVRANRFELAISGLIQQEISSAPLRVRELLSSLREHTFVEDITSEATDLQDAYLNAGILTQRSLTDALHIAIATLSRCEIIVSWNFRDIVNFRKIPQYNAVNIAYGYNELRIMSPPEAVIYEEEV